MQNLSATKNHAPYESDGINKIYQMLFCDDIELYQNNSAPKMYPWSVLLSEKSSTDDLIKVSEDKTLEARTRILAYHLLRETGNIAAQKEMLGVVIEVGIDDSVDVLAAYSDGTARYINQSGKMIVWDTKTNESDQLINELFSVSKKVVEQIGVWDDARKPAPANNMIRLNFLVSDGLYFGEGPMNILQSDPMGGPVIYAGIQLMQFLIERTS